MSMNTGDYKECKVLYVDDEAQSLKYFVKAFEHEFDVYTASSSEEAWELIQRENGNFHLLLSDQRMPGKQGVDLLSDVKNTYPKMMRLLTTAYSDLDSAIRSVNEGSIYRYVVKPWDFQELKITLKHALDFYLIREDRDFLLKQKLSVLQRLMIMDRMHSFSILATSMANNIRNSMCALSTYFELLPTGLQDAWTEEAMNEGQAKLKDLGSLAKEESEYVLEIVEKIVNSLQITKSEAFERVSLTDMVQVALDAAAENYKQKSLTLDIENPITETAECLADHTMLQRGISTLIEAVSSISASSSTMKIRIHAKDSLWDVPAVRITISLPGQQWGTEEVAEMFNVFFGFKDQVDISLNILNAFFIVYHHGGDLRLNQESKDGAGFELLLPYDPEQSKHPKYGEGFMEKIFTRFSAWDSANL